MSARATLAGALVAVALVACGDGGGAVVDAQDIAVELADDVAEVAEVVADVEIIEDVEIVEGPALAPWPVVADPSFEAFFRRDAVQRVTLRVERAEWDALIAHMLEYAAIDPAMRTNRYFRATFVHTAPDGGEEVIEEIGFRTRGNTTRDLPEDADGAYHRAHFKLKFDALFDLTPGTPAYEERDARRFRGMKELSLKWERGDDPTQIRELFAYDLLRRIGVPAPRVGPVALTFEIGGEPVYFGLYLAIEGVDKPFLTKRVGADHNDGDLYKCLWLHEGPATLEPITNPRAVGVKDWERDYRPAYDLQTNEETSTHADLLALIDALDALDGEALRTWLDARFEVEPFLRWLAANVLIGMPDDYWAMGNNYYLYFGPERALFIPWDYDHGLGGGWGGEPAWSHAAIATADVFAWKNLNAAFGRPGARHPLVDKILVIPEYRARYVALLRALIDPARDLFGRAPWAALYESQAPLYAPWLVNDTGEGEVMERTGAEESWIDTRVESVRAQLDAP
ncbi:MAG: CotH kinase family protein [Deltaproteobacteria bacterium]|nr:CotH kinase family protein [Deltaproteobacteria bacterium]